MTFSAYRTLPLPEQCRLLHQHGRLLATRREGGVRQELYDLRGFWVEAWHWADDGSVGLIHSFADAGSLDVWLEGIRLENA